MNRFSAVLGGAACALAFVGYGSGVRANGTTGPAGGGAPFDTTQSSIGINFLVRNDSASLHTGDIRLFAGTTLPSGFVPAEGQVLSVQENPLLFDWLGNTYGGDGQNDFAVPDLRGRMAVGTGQGAGLSDRALGARFGSETVTLTQDQMPAHTHSAAAPFGPATGSTGGGQPHDTTQPSLGLNYRFVLDGNPPSGPMAAAPYKGQVKLTARVGDTVDEVPADGRLLSSADQSELFALLGTTYGGDGRTNFAIPDLRGRGAAGAGGARFTGEMFGSETLTLTQDHLPAHDHTLPPPGGNTGNAGGNQEHDTTQPSLAVSYIIAVEGFAAPVANGGPGANEETFLGEIALFAGEVAPDGWLRAEGQIFPVDAFPELYAVIGDTYGGFGDVAFALPDLTGLVPVGVGAGAGPGLTERALGERFGSDVVMLSEDNLPSHVHGVVPEPAAGAALALFGAGALAARRRRPSRAN